ncbi:MAG TPA: hypothetical protein VGE12_00325 [Noviherbaspirillum sp.]
MPVITPELSCAGAVRIRASAKDQHEGLRGHAYIAARQLDARVQRLDADPQHHAERVQNIIDQWKPRAKVFWLCRPIKQFRAPRAF